jgi:Flp pilus assembly protein TadB
MSPDAALILLILAGFTIGGMVLWRLLPLATERGRLQQKRREIERRANRRVLYVEQQSPRERPHLTFGCLMKWLAALGLASWTAGLAAWAVYVIVALVVLLTVLLLALAFAGISICFTASFIQSNHP